MGEYLCPKIKKDFMVSKESYEVCSDCRESKGNPLVCHYNKNFKIPVPGELISEKPKGLTEIITKIPKKGPHRKRIVT